MAFVDRFEINKAIRAGLNASAALKTLIGTPVRVFTSVPREAAFPYAIMRHAEARMITGTRPTAGGPPNWVRAHAVGFLVVDDDTSIDDVSAAQKLIANLMDAAPGFSVTGGTITHSIPQEEAIGFDEEKGLSWASLSYLLFVEAA